jgi:hypothetical protein
MVAVLIDMVGNVSRKEQLNVEMVSRLSQRKDGI